MAAALWREVVKLIALIVLGLAFFYIRKERREAAEKRLGRRILKDYVYHTVEVPESAGPR